MNEAAGLGMLEILRVLAALAVVVGLAVASGWFLRRRGGRGLARSLRVEERLQVSRGVQLLIVEADAKRLLVGVSEKGVQLVGELEAAPVTRSECAGEEEPSHSRSTLVAQAPHALAGTINFAKVLAGRLRARGGVS